jgi:hypothetical protein
MIRPDARSIVLALFAFAQLCLAPLADASCGTPAPSGAEAACCCAPEPVAPTPARTAGCCSDDEAPPADEESGCDCELAPAGPSLPPAELPRSGSATCAVAAPIGAPLVVPRAPERFGVPRRGDRRGPPPAVPLFLLHRALLR